MNTYTVSQVVPSIRKIRLIKDIFQREYYDFMGDFSDEALDEYGRYMRALEKYPRDESEADFYEFEKAFYNQKEAWNFTREIIKLFGFLNEFKCKNCIVQSPCYVNMTDEQPDNCYDAARPRDFKVGFILFVYLKYFKIEKAFLIYE